MLFDIRPYLKYHPILYLNCKFDSKYFQLIIIFLNTLIYSINFILKNNNLLKMFSQVYNFFFNVRYSFPSFYIIYNCRKKIIR